MRTRGAIKWVCTVGAVVVAGVWVVSLWFRQGSDAIAVLWAPLLLFSINAALFWFVDLKNRRAALVGVCPACRYDRRGLAADAACPECGKGAA